MAARGVAGGVGEADSGEILRDGGPKCRGLANGVHADGGRRWPSAQMNGHAKGMTNGQLPHDYPKKPRGGDSTSAKESYEEVPLFVACLTYLGFYLLMVLGYFNQLFFTPKVAKERHRDGYPSLYDNFERFYFRYVYRRVRDCWNRPICSVPGAEVVLKDRVTKDYGWTFEFTGTQTKCLNLGSYNYLGFAEETGPCAEAVEATIREYGLASCSARRELGNSPLHEELETLTAEFLGVEDAIVFGMGFATNSLNLPTLLSPGCLCVSDEKNHASIILGLRLSGAKTVVFKHNNMRDLERVLERNVVNGQPGTGAPWKKILIVVEGIFSMEGSIVKLPEIIALKKKYKAYLYLDEAHSIGASGPHGRGVVDYFGIDPREVDILMGTFTKSFGSAGGYIAGEKRLINFLRSQSHAHCYASSMAPPVAQQILTSMKIIMGKEDAGEGARRIDQLARNTRYFRRRLAQIGVITFGHEDSPVVPMLVYLFSKLGAVVRTLTTKNIAVVGVGFPATPLMEGRIRFCLSAAHTKEQLDYALAQIDEISDTMGLKYSRKPRDPNPIIY
ncbi:serine palmitoyltransferase 2 [Phlebotomus argentipes]|uniref:serine palmitoyltransferase 2 n=1 Tax=Phlebotomus argentipes TaxID=94469 RepID=UPI0028937527|nr:serine palmitoyltransferase 2 [Phlebotomus argentipes]